MAGLSQSSGALLRPRVAFPAQTCRSAPALRAKRQVTRAIADCNIIISGATAASLALGRFVFLPFQRDNVNRQGLGKQNGETHPEAGDRFAQEASFVLKSNDPEGFNIIDVLAWGSIGHALGYFILATTSLNASGFNPKPF